MGKEDGSATKAPPVFVVELESIVVRIHVVVVFHLGVYFVSVVDGRFDLIRKQIRGIRISEF